MFFEVCKTILQRFDYSTLKPSRPRLKSQLNPSLYPQFYGFANFVYLTPIYAK